MARTIRARTHDEFRLTLGSSAEFAGALDDPTGSELGRLECELRVRFGTRGGTRGLVSVVSKLATFIRPERFTAWDQFAQRGLNVALGRSKSRWFPDYAAYLTDFNELWKRPLGQRICEITEQAGRAALETEPRFQRRILDLYLMTAGGYGEGNWIAGTGSEADVIIHS